MQTSDPATTEAWLRGPVPGVHPLVMPVFFSYQMVREDLARSVVPLASDQVWCDIHGTSIGFHLKHLAGSVDRLTTYLMGNALTDLQLRALHSERLGNESAGALYLQVEEHLRESEAHLQTINPAALYEARTVGRLNLPTTVLGLIVHLAEHTQRHLGQLITLSKAVRLAG